MSRTWPDIESDRSVVSAPKLGLLLILLQWLAVAGCNSSSDPTSPTQTSQFSGVWTGVTDQNEPIRFTVADGDDGLELIAAELAIELPDSVPNSEVIVVCFSGGGSLNLSIDRGLRHRFDGQRFDLRLPEDLAASVPALGSGFLIFEGELEAATRATGTLIAEAPLPFISLPCLFRGETSWTANK